MNVKLEMNVAEAIDTYYNLVDYHEMCGFPKDHPSVIFLGKLRAFLIEEGVELK